MSFYVVCREYSSYNPNAEDNLSTAVGLNTGQSPFNV